MANVPFPITGTDLGALKRQVFELIRQVYEEKIGGADLGDVFSLSGDVLTLALDPDAPGLQKTNNELSVMVTSDGGLQISSDGISIKVVSTGGIEVSASGLAIKLDGTSLTSGASGLKVGQSIHINDPAGGVTIDAEARTAIIAILDLLEARGLMAA